MFSLEWMSFEWIMCERDMQGQAPLLSILPYIAAILWMDMLGRINELFLLESSSARLEQHLLSPLEA